MTPGVPFDVVGKGDIAYIVTTVSDLDRESEDSYTFTVSTFSTPNIAPVNVTKRYQYTSYFSTKTYVVDFIRSALPRHF